MSFPSKSVVLIDGGYWRSLVSALKISKINLMTFSDQICEPAYRIRTLYYDGKEQKNQSFQDSLRSNNRFEIILGDVVTRPVTCTHCHKDSQIPVQKRVDVAIAVEIVHLASTGQVDVINLVAGDQDFLPAIEAAKRTGLIIRLFYFKDTVSLNLLRAVDERIEITKTFLKNLVSEVTFKDDAIKKIEVKVKASPPASKTTSVSTPAPQPDLNITPPDVADMHTHVKNVFNNKSVSELSYSMIGEILMETFPGWKKMYGYKKFGDYARNYPDLYDFDKRNTTNILIFKGSDKKEQLHMLLEDFIWNGIVSYFAHNTEALSLVTLGTLLKDRNPNWRSQYHAKSLKKEILKFTDRLETKIRDSHLVITKLVSLDVDV